MRTIILLCLLAAHAHAQVVSIPNGTYNVCSEVLW